MDGEIANEKLKDFVRSMSLDDVSKLKNITKKITSVSNNQIPNNAKKELIKIKNELDKIVNEHSK